MERRTSWALPPQAPETWVGGRWTAALLLSVALAVVVPLTALPADPGAAALAAALVHAVAAIAALTSAYVLHIQTTVTADRRLRWVAGSLVGLAALMLLRAQQLDPPAEMVLGDPDPVGGLTLLALLVVPVCALTAGLAGRLVRGLALAQALALVVLAVLVLPGRLPTLVGDRQEHRTVLRLALVAVALLAVLAARRWRRVTLPAGGGRPAGAWGWVWACAALTAVAAGVSALAPQRWTPAWWTGLAAELLAVLVPALGLALVSATGYRRQSRRWRQLLTEVGQLRAASPLLPGLSVTPDDDEGLPEEGDVRTLIDEGLVRVALQPVVRLSDGEVVGYEALSRFGGRVPTDRWFRGATRCGLGGELERLTLDAALALFAQLPQDVFLAVNVSPLALDDPAVVDLLRSVDLTRIVVEVTEHEAVGDYPRTRAVLEDLRSRGARIAVDDTGAGFASLRHVLMLQPDVIKLDNSLTRDVQDSARQQSLVLALAGFAREVGSLVLAEGIEHEEQMVALRDLGVPLGQGWHLGVPTIVRPL